MLELSKFLPFARHISPKKNELSTQQQEAQTIIVTSKNFPKSIPSMLRLTEVNPKDPFDPFSLGFPGKDLLDVLISEQAAETIMAENTSAEVRQIVREYFEKSITLYSAMLGDVFLQAQCISSLRSMADIMLQTYEKIGTINGGSIDRQHAIKMCHGYAKEYQNALPKSFQHH